MRLLASVVVLVVLGVYGGDGDNGGIHHRDSGENGVNNSYSAHSAASVVDRTPLHHPQRPPSAPRRIISLIPAVTEMLFAIGAGPQVVAVSSFDRYPPQVEKLQRVGALIDPDVERILSLRPDMVAIYASQGDLRAQLERAKIPIYVRLFTARQLQWIRTRRDGGER